MQSKRMVPSCHHARLNWKVILMGMGWERHKWCKWCSTRGMTDIYWPRSGLQKVRRWLLFLIYVVPGSGKEWSLGCVILASWPPLAVAVGAHFTQPRDPFFSCYFMYRWRVRASCDLPSTSAGLAHVTTIRTAPRPLPSSSIDRLHHRRRHEIRLFSHAGCCCCCFRWSSPCMPLLVTKLKSLQMVIALYYERKWDPKMERK